METKCEKDIRIEQLTAEIKNYRRQQAVDSVLHVLMLVGIVCMALKVGG